MTGKMKSFLLGLIAGLAGKPLEFAPGEPSEPAPEPVAYLYNGVRVPAPPSHDKPYSLIQIVMSGNVVLRVCYYAFSSYEFGVVSDTTGAWGIKMSSDAIEAELDNTNLTSGGAIAGSWGEFETVTDNTMANTAIDWANIDILNEAGTVFLAASEPIPVYE